MSIRFFKRLLRVKVSQGLGRAPCISKRGLLNRDKGLIGTWILYGNCKSTKALARTLQIMQTVK